MTISKRSQYSVPNTPYPRIREGLSGMGSCNVSPAMGQVAIMPLAFDAAQKDRRRSILVLIPQPPYRYKTNSA
jgi:hypothetical protein